MGSIIYCNGVDSDTKHGITNVW